MPRKGFTLVELMIVIALIAVLSTIALFGVQKMQAASRDNSRIQIMKALQVALERYKADKGGYPYNGGTRCSSGTYYGFFDLVYPTDPNSLHKLNYIDTYSLKDPSTRSELWSGGSSGPISIGTYSFTANGCSLKPNKPGIDPKVEYFYASSTGEYYVLRLYKESGGFIDFTSPQ